MKRKLEDLLDKLNMPLSNLGYRYWVTAVLLFKETQEKNITNLYIDVAKKHKSTASRVEKAMRHEYEKNKDIIKQYFNINYNISNKRLLSLLAREMEKEL